MSRNNDREIEPLRRIVRVQFSIIHTLAWLVSAAVTFARKTIGSQASPAPTKLVIESGTLGWELIEYQELLASARERFGAQHVVKLEISSRRDYIGQVRRIIQNERPTHYFYDPRTGSQQASRGLFEAFQLSILFAWKNVVPIAWLTDTPIRAWRRQCVTVTAKSGMIVTLMNPKLMQRFFPHRRVFGPSIMALSSRLLQSFVNEDSAALREMPDRPRVAFVGSLYEPRTSFLQAVQDLMVEKGHSIEFFTRELADDRISNDDYWLRIREADILITTADQVTGTGIDPIGLPHLIFRYSETLAAGTLLLAPDVPGVEKYFVPGEHFVAYSDASDAAEKIAFYLRNSGERLRIASRGRERMSQLTESGSFWQEIHNFLAADGF